MSISIKFGTSGWRGLIARDFTFDGVRLAAQGIADYLNAELNNPQSAIAKRKPVVIIGHDTRFLGREFSLAVAEVLTANGLTCLLCQRDAPTPVIAHTIRHRKAIGGINMTASHNPAEYQGLKFSTYNGAPATAEVTKHVEANIAKRQAEGWTFKAAGVGTFSCKTIDPQPDYFKQIRKLIDFAAIKKAKLKIAVELMYGTGRGYLDTLLTEDGGAKVTTFHNELNPLFGGHHPEPDAHGMEEVSKFVLAGKAQFGLGLDGDADRFGVVDKSGVWLTPNQILALALYHLKKNRGWTGAVVRTVPTSHQVDAVAELLGVKLHETPVGFKYIGALMESEPIIVGGEESGSDVDLDPIVVATFDNSAAAAADTVTIIVLHDVHVCQLTPDSYVFVIPRGSDVNTLNQDLEKALRRVQAQEVRLRRARRRRRIGRGHDAHIGPRALHL